MPDQLPLAGKSILVIEDELLIAMGVEYSLKEAGAASVTIASSVAQAQTALLKGSYDAAVVDFRLSDGDASVLIDTLSGRVLRRTLAWAREGKGEANAQGCASRGHFVRLGGLCPVDLLVGREPPHGPRDLELKPLATSALRRRAAGKVHGLTHLAHLLRHHQYSSTSRARTPKESPGAGQWWSGLTVVEQLLDGCPGLLEQPLDGGRGVGRAVARHVTCGGEFRGDLP